MIKTITAEAKLLEQFKIEGKVRDLVFYADQPTQGGGTNIAPAPLEYMIFSLAACIITIAQVVAKQKRINLRGITVRAEGDVDADVLMGKSTENRAGFLGMKVITHLDADMSLEEKQAFLAEVDRRCPVSDNLKELTPITYEIE